MSSKSKNLNREFGKSVLAAAKKIAEKYEVILSCENDRWYGKGVEMPMVFGDGKTPDECIQQTIEGLISAVAHLLEQGEVVPSPASEGKRTEQVNVRLSTEEKTILSALASSRGYRGIGDYIRAKALAVSS
jgi:predicted RNase H-like HicB family nuclease